MHFAVCDLNYWQINTVFHRNKLIMDHCVDMSYNRLYTVDGSWKLRPEICSWGIRQLDRMRGWVSSIHKGGGIHFKVCSTKYFSLSRISLIPSKTQDERIRFGERRLHSLLCPALWYLRGKRTRGQWGRHSRHGILHAKRLINNYI